MIRFKRYSYENLNEKFHSIFATMIFIGVIAYFIFFKAQHQYFQKAVRKAKFSIPLHLRQQAYIVRTQESANAPLHV